MATWLYWDGEVPIVTAVPSLVVAAPLGNEYFFLPILLDNRGLADMIG